MEDDVENGEHERKYDQNKYARKSERERERKRACQAHKAPATLPSHRLIGRPGVRPGRPNLVRAPSLAAGQVVRDVTAASRDRGRWSPQPASQREREEDGRLTKNRGDGSTNTSWPSVDDREPVGDESPSRSLHPFPMC